MSVLLSIIYCLLFLHFNSQASEKINLIIINKENRNMSIFIEGEIVKKLNISLGFEPKGKKIKKGDGKTPEGLYFIEQKIKNSSFYLALKISYPNAWDIRRALKLDYHPGGQIMIHGRPNIGFDPNYHNQKFDWTEGCVAIKNSEVLYLWERTKLGTPILILK